ncbi:MAG: hypothetical protein J3Q66DRAFT_394109 [Benniella sp.]|nr:MAG: hypothetical protein J3Q66DRAFT_394109 [Benniella sp.]
MPQIPGATDKVFLPISIFVLNVVLALFRVTLLSAVGACFIIYSRYGGEYANSVRWVRSAGYLEMFQTLRSTKNKHVPGSVKLALVLGIIVTLAASLLDKGIAAFITPATRDGPSSRVFTNTTQPILSSYPKNFLGWKLVVPDKGNVTEIIQKALVGPIALPRPEKGYTYTPATSVYHRACNAIGLQVEFDGEKLKNGGCATAKPFTSTIDVSPTTSKLSGDRYRLTMPKAPQPYLSAALEWTYSYGYAENDEKCVLKEDYQRPVVFSGGFAAPPRTSTTKCFFSALENVAVLSMTTIRFSSVEYSTKIVQEYLAGGSNELLSAMEKAINTTPQPQNGTEVGLWAIFQVANTTVEFYACDDTYDCVYGIISSIYFNQPQKELMNVTNESDLRTYDVGTYMTLEYPLSTHTTTIDGKIKVKLSPVSIEKMRNDTAAVADYMARLGTHLFASFEKSTLYLQYDITEVISGLEVTFWVLAAAVIILIASFLSWQMTNVMIGPPHHSSLYSVIRSRLASRSDAPVSRLMRFRYEPLMFEDVKLLPDHVEHSSSEELSPGDVKDHTNPSTV